MGAQGDTLFGLLQFSVTEHFREMEVASGRSLPGVFFFYDLSPIKVTNNLNRRLVLLAVEAICCTY
jgi:hypothetical protein